MSTIKMYTYNMPNKLFKQDFPLSLLIEMFDNISHTMYNGKYYTIKNDSFKKGMYNNSIPNFFINCTDYYHESKHYYLNRKPTYKTFMTVIRQLCKHLSVPYHSVIVYNMSKYEIIYYVYLEKNTESS